MNTEYINEFLVLIESPNLAEAAFTLNVSESSLSRHIKAMEDELGCQLFERTSRSFRLNSFGRTFLPYARDITALYQRCTNVMREAAAREKSSVAIVSNYYIGNFLADFYRKTPSIDANLVDSPNDLDSIKGKLRNHECTFAFVMDFSNEDPKEFVTLPFVHDHFAALVPAGHRLAGEQSVAVDKLSDEDFVSFRKHSSGDIGIKKICHASGFAPHIRITADSGIAVTRLVEQGLGVSIMHRKSLFRMGLDISGIRVLDLVPEHFFTVSLVYRRDTKLSQAEETFLRYIESVRDLD